jgi:hypothetical protein
LQASLEALPTANDPNTKRVFNVDGPHYKLRILKLSKLEWKIIKILDITKFQNIIAKY